MDKKQLLKKIKYSMRFLPDKLYLQVYYFAQFHKFINFKNPKTYNEKLNWLKLNDRNPEYTKMVDKYEAKEYVKNIIGEEYIIPTLGVWDKFDDIDFDKLPNRFVLKCTHDSGGIVMCKDKKTFDIQSAKKYLSTRLNEKYFFIGREWPYKEVKPRIIAEKYIEDSEMGELRDYKLMSFNGKVKCSFVCSERDYNGNLKVDFFDNDWNKLPFTRKYGNSIKEIKQPQKFAEMKELAEKLSVNIPFVRVDFYEVSGKIYFGELTLYPGCGFEKFNPDEYDKKLGDLLILPEKGDK